MPATFRLLFFALFVLPALLLTFMRSATPAYACTPPAGGLPVVTVADLAEEASIIFVAEVIQTQEISTATPPGQQATPTPGDWPPFGEEKYALVQVEQYYLSNGPDQLSIGPFAYWYASCRQEIFPGERYIFFAKGDPNSGVVAAEYDYETAALPPSPENIEALTRYLNGQPTMTPTPTATPTIEVYPPPNLSQRLFMPLQFFQSLRQAIFPNRHFD